jgi:hypothetical protein
VIAEHMASTRPTATDFGVTALFSPWLGFLILLIYWAFRLNSERSTQPVTLMGPS